MEIVEQAQEYFRSKGIDQWQNNYPTEGVFLTDMELGESFVLEEDGQVVGTFMASFREDPTYQVIVDGDWQYKEPYAVIHRVAMDNRVKGRGYGSQVIQFMVDQCLNREEPVYVLRGDTHQDNLSMQRVFEKNGYRHAGTTFLADGSKRWAFEKKLLNIRRAKISDMDGINDLLCQVLMVHHNGRPDLFKAGAKKYTDEELAAIIADDAKPIFVAVDQSGKVLGYAFCVHQQYVDNNIMTDVKTLYIDDLCVDENRRGMHIGRQLYDHVVEYAKNSGCYNVTLNVWSLNPGAMKFYEKCGLAPQKVGMEKIL